LSISRGPKTHITFNKIVPPNSRAQKLFRTSSSYFLLLRATTAVIDGGGIFGIWRVGEEIWVRFFGANGLRGSWFLFFSWRGGGGGGGVLGVLIGGSELEWEMRRTGWGDRRGALCTGFTLVWLKTCLTNHIISKFGQMIYNSIHCFNLKNWQLNSISQKDLFPQCSCFWISMIPRFSSKRYPLVNS
jgi:hypothetical protein